MAKIISSEFGIAVKVEALKFNHLMQILLIPSCFPPCLIFLIIKNILHLKMKKANPYVYLKSHLDQFQTLVMLSANIEFGQAEGDVIQEEKNKRQLNVSKKN